MTAYHVTPSYYEYRRHSDGAEKLRERTAELSECHHMVHTAGIVAYGFHKTAVLHLFHLKRLHRTYACNILFYYRKHRSQLVLPLDGVAFETLPHRTDQKQQHRHHQKKIKEQHRTDEYQRRREDYNIDRRLQKRLERTDYAPLDIGYIVRHTAQYIACTLTLEEGYGQYRYLVEDIVAQTFYNPVTDRTQTPQRQESEEVGKQRAEQKRQRYGRKAEEDTMGITPLVQLPLQPGAHVSLVEGELVWGRHLGASEKELHERHNKNKRREVEQHTQDVEQQTEEDILRIVAEIGKNTPQWLCRDLSLAYHSKMFDCCAVFERTPSTSVSLQTAVLRCRQLYRKAFRDATSARSYSRTRPSLCFR